MKNPIDPDTPAHARDKKLKANIKKAIKKARVEEREEASNLSEPENNEPAEMAQRLVQAREEAFRTIAAAYNRARLPFLRVHSPDKDYPQEQPRKPTNKARVTDKRIVVEALERLEQRLAKQTVERGYSWRDSQPS